MVCDAYIIIILCWYSFFRIFRPYMLNLNMLKFIYLYGTLNGSLPAADHMTTTFEYHIVLRWAWFIEMFARNVGLDNADDYGPTELASR